MGENFICDFPNIFGKRMKRTDFKHPINTVIFFAVLCLLTFGKAKAFNSNEKLYNSDSISEISLEITEYGLIFTEIIVNGSPVKAMIDFGDGHELQLSSSLVKDLGLKIESTNAQVADLFGNTWELFEGKVDHIMIGNWLEKEMIFTMQEGEMESVAQQIGYEFHAVLGWGYFRNYITEIDYKTSRFILYKNGFEPKNEWLSFPFTMDTGQLIFLSKVQNQQLKFMIDTGSPVTVIDPSISKFSDEGYLEFEIKGKVFRQQVFEQDLSVLMDLEVAGIIGGDFLSHFRTIINPEEKVIYLIENP